MSTKLRNIIINFIENIAFQLDKIVHKNHTNISTKTTQNNDINNNINKIEEEVEIVEFFKKKYRYTIQPHEHYIYNNIDNLFEKVQIFFKNRNYIPNIGIEIEFYLLNSKVEIKNFYKEIYNFSKENNIDIYEIEQERGSGQFEIKFKPYQNIEKLITD